MTKMGSEMEDENEVVSTGSDCTVNKNIMQCGWKPEDSVERNCGLHQCPANAACIFQNSY